MSLLSLMGFPQIASWENDLDYSGAWANMQVKLAGTSFKASYVSNKYDFCLNRELFSRKVTSAHVLIPRFMLLRYTLRAFKLLFYPEEVEVKPAPLYKAVPANTSIKCRNVLRLDKDLQRTALEDHAFKDFHINVYSHVAKNSTSILCLRLLPCRSTEHYILVKYA